MAHLFLILEDDLEVQGDLKEIICNVNDQNEVLTTNNARDGLTMLANCDFAALFVDIHLIGKESGWDFIKQVRAQNPFIPIAVISSTATTKEMLDGFNRYQLMGGIDKPYTEEQVRKVVTKAVTFLKQIDDEVISIKGYDSTSEKYRSKDLYCVERINKKRSVVITAYDSKTKQVVETEVPLKGSIMEIANKFKRNKTLLRCHQSALVNPRRIQKIDWRNDKVTLTNGKKLPIGGENYKRELELFME